MKKYMELIVMFKFVWGLIFTAAIVLYTTISMILGKTQMDFIVVWQLVAVTMVLVFIHYMIFGEFILQKASTMTRLTVHFSLCYLTLLVSGLATKLINVTRFNHYVIFSVGFIILYAAMAFSLFVYYKGTGEELNKRLAVYKQNKSYREVKK